MKIDIVSWECQGLRCPDMKIDLMDGNEPAQVALIQMPNGTGKTTTLQMLTATLTGTASRWTPEDVREMCRPGESHNSGRFLVNLRADDKPITFELILDFVEGHVQYRTTTPATGGMISAWEPPPGLRRFLTENFIQLFVFDGEYAERLLNQNANEAERAIDALCQLYLVDDISDVAFQDWEQAVRAGGPTSPTGLTMAQNKLTKIQKQIAKTTDAQTRAQKRLDELRIKIAELNAKIEKHISDKTDLREQHEQALVARRDAQATLENKLMEAMRQIRFPNALHPAFGKALISLKQNLDRLKLPEATSRQFFVELAEEELCICGRALDEQSRTAIIDRSTLYLGQEEAGSINALKKDIDTHCGNSANEPARQLQSVCSEMLDAMTSLQLADQNVRTLKQSLIDSGDEAFAALETDLDQSIAEESELKDLLQAIESESTGKEVPEDTLCLKALKAAEKETLAKIAKISGTLKLKKQTDIIRDIVENAKTFARNEIRESLRDECNRMLLKVLANDPLQIADIAGSLSIQNQNRASVGQTLSVGYIFLMSLLSRGNNQFPLVVDSPCGSLGGGRREAIGELIPKLCTQFITFVIDMEREDFLPALERSCKGSIKYLTAFRNTTQNEHWFRSLPKIGVTQTTNATIVEGRDYFINFKE